MSTAPVCVASLQPPADQGQTGWSQGYTPDPSLDSGQQRSPCGIRASGKHCAPVPQAPRCTAHTARWRPSHGHHRCPGMTPTMRGIGSSTGPLHRQSPPFQLHMPFPSQMSHKSRGSSRPVRNPPVDVQCGGFA